MKQQFMTLALAAAVATCGGPSPDMPDGPPWLVELIEDLEAQPVANPPAFIARQEYETGVYYYLPSRCCDIWSELYDSDGTLVCHPDGGITGRGDGRCPPLGEPLAEKVVWRDDRQPD